MHLLETAYQKEYARRRGGCTAVEDIDRFGLLGPQMTLGRGVWLNEPDIERLAARRVAAASLPRRTPSASSFSGPTNASPAISSPTSAAGQRPMDAIRRTS